MIYETKGLSLEQVDQLYEEISSAHLSARWTPTHAFHEASTDHGTETKSKSTDDKNGSEQYEVVMNERHTA